MSTEPQQQKAHSQGTERAFADRGVQLATLPEGPLVATVVQTAVGAEARMAVEAEKLLRVDAPCLDYGYERDGSTTKQTARVVLCFDLTSIGRRTEQIGEIRFQNKGIKRSRRLFALTGAAAMSIDFGIDAESEDDVIIDAINPDSAETVTIHNCTIFHEAKTGLEPSITTSGGRIPLCAVKSTVQWAIGTDIDLKLTIDRERKGVKVQLFNPRAAHIPGNYRILVKIARIGERRNTGVSMDASGKLHERSATFPFTLTVSKDSQVVFWRNQRRVAIWRSPHALPFKFTETQNRGMVLEHTGTLGLVEALRAMTEQIGFQDGAGPTFHGITELYSSFFFYLVVMFVGVAWVLDVLRSS